MKFQDFSRIIPGLFLVFKDSIDVVVVNQFWHFIAAYELFVLFFSSVFISCTLSHVATFSQFSIDVARNGDSEISCTSFLSPEYFHYGIDKYRDYR